jgi:hypothetical protein
MQGVVNMTRAGVDEQQSVPNMKRAGVDEQQRVYPT